MSADTQQSEAERRKESKETYQRMLSIIDYQTGSGDQLPAMATKTSITQVVAQSNIDLSDGRSALRAAIENGDVLDWHGQVAIADEANLLRVIEWEASKSQPRTLLIGKCNKLRADLRGGSGE